jgi:hypothetical protein
LQLDFSETLLNIKVIVEKFNESENATDAYFALSLLRREGEAIVQMVDHHIHRCQVAALEDIKDEILKKAKKKK